MNDKRNIVDLFHYGDHSFHDQDRIIDDEDSSVFFFHDLHSMAQRNAGKGPEKIEHQTNRA
jgi:hypothetical protein